MSGKISKLKLNVGGCGLYGTTLLLLAWVCLYVKAKSDKEYGTLWSFQLKAFSSEVNTKKEWGSETILDY